MHPSKTLYRLAEEADYETCYKILKKNKRPAHWQLNFPTVVAVRRGRVIGFLSTVKSDWALMAGPLESPNVFVSMRLAEAYENALRFMGVSRYCFFIRKDHPNPKWAEQAGQLATPIKQDSERIYYERIL